MEILGPIKSRLRETAVYQWLQNRKSAQAISQWVQSGKPAPPPPAYKHKLIRDIANRFETRVLIETGTNSGNTVVACLRSFDTIYSIELFDPLYEKATKRFAHSPKVKLSHGDSAIELPRILNDLKQPALFWLDAHYSGEGTAQADIDTPVVQELNIILEHPIKNHVILVDDARLFDGTNGYPTIESCRLAVLNFLPGHKLEVENDVIIITPQEK